MKKLIAFCLVAAFAFVNTALCATTPANDAWIGARPATKITVSSAGDHAYRINVTIRDLRNGNVLSQPELITKTGLPNKIRVGTTGSPGAALVSFTITIAPDGKSAAYSSKFSTNGEVLTAQEGTLVVNR